MSAGLPAITTAANPTNGKSLPLPKVVISEILRFFDNPFQLAVIERVSRTWRLAAEPIWKGLYVNTLRIPPAISVLHQVGQSLTGFNDKTLSLIAEYGQFGHKDEVRGLLASIKLGQSVYIDKYAKNETPNTRRTLDRWGNDQTEAFVQINITSFCQSKPRSLQEFYTGRCWHRDPPNGVEALPNEVPLRLFINRDGSYKKNGDLIKIQYKGQRLILKCVYKPEHRDDTFYPTLGENLAKRVSVSLTLKLISPELVAGAQATAAISGEWIDSE
jgi:hypothetical protein